MNRFHVQLLCAVALVTLAAYAQPAGLRIVVVEGEDAVNIIQQKTAVRPVVEVRDRNNLPVSGALVTFSIEGGKAASFGGASTLTVATNAAGQAAVTGLTPATAGAFQIQVSAAFQGQVATATIAQTNVMTAAQAASAAAATSSGGSAGSAGGGAGGGAGGAGGAAGGGLSATTIGIAGAAVAGGAVAATQVIRNNEESGESTYTGSFSGTVVSTLVSRNSGNTCTINRTVSGTATLKINGDTTSAISGTLEFTGSDTVVAATCPVVNPSTPFAGRTAVNGTASAIRGSEARDETSAGTGGETIQTTRTISVEASLSGDTVTGTMRFETRSVSTGGGGGPVDGSSTSSFPFTLRKM